MGRRVGFALAAVSAVVLVALVAAQPAEAEAPSWMRPLIDVGRDGISRNFDQARTGSQVAFTEARCRADGALLLLYTQRWMWLMPQHFGVEVPPDWQAQKAWSFAGGVREALEVDYGENLDGYFATYPEIDCPEDPLAVTKPSLPPPAASPTIAPSPSPTPAPAPTITAEPMHRPPVIVPAAVAARPALPWCGHEVVIRRPTGDFRDAEVRRCWLEAFEAGDQAEFTSDGVTVEGGRVREFYRALGEGALEVFIDWTADPFSARDWTTMRCTKIRTVATDPAGVEVFVPADCSAPEVLDAEAESWPNPDELLLLENLVRFAQVPDAGALSRLPFAGETALGLADRLMVTRSPAVLADPRAWLLDEEAFRARAGPFSALDLLAEWDRAAAGEAIREMQATIGAHPNCASPAIPPPADVTAMRRLSLQPIGHSSCLGWWTVDVFLTPDGTIAAITLDLYEP